MERAPVERPDLAERGGPRDGVPQKLDRRLFMQFLAFTGCADPGAAAEALAGCGLDAAFYDDVHDPRGFAVLLMSEDPGAFLDAGRAVLSKSPFDGCQLRHDLGMLGRTYSLGYEPDLEDALFGRPRRTALNPDWPWVVWYPLRRKGGFMNLPADEQRKILMEHGTIGRAYGEADLGHDIRLACHGLDPNDNDFVIGLTGRELHPLSALVQRMRQTQQTSQWIERLGPFFVGRARWKSAL